MKSLEQSKKYCITFANGKEVLMRPRKKDMRTMYGKRFVKIYATK